MPEGPAERRPMSKAINQECPLCGGAASYRAVQEPDGKRFDCPVCTDFFIDATSEATLASFVEVTRTERRAALSALAKSSSPSKLLVIRKPRPEEVAHEGPGMARTNMVMDVVRRQ